MKKKKKRIIKLIIFIVIIYLSIHFLANNGIKTIANSINSQKYKPIALNENHNYPGLGKLPVEDKDGYFSTFTTISKNQKTYKEYKQNGTSSWKENKYWGGTMQENGCRNNCYFHNS